jgi:hypothetical protein
MHSPRRYVLVELGPGPTRLAALKRALFKDVVFVDFRDYGMPDRSLRLADLERFATESVDSIIGRTTAGGDFFFLADHCLEHLSEKAATRFLEQVAQHPRWMCCVRVPNVLSRGGQQNYSADVTHRTSFGSELRARLTTLGFALAPWFRFYRLPPMLEALSQRSAALGSEEVALIKPTTESAAPGPDLGSPPSRGGTA